MKFHCRGDPVTGARDTNGSPGILVLPVKKKVSHPGLLSGITKDGIIQAAWENDGDTP
jgi:hypothetical protein